MTDRIDAYCSMAHYVEHLQPILEALPDHLRGAVYAPQPIARQIGYARPGSAPSSSLPLLVAGYQDLVYSRRPKVLVQHGAGQTYAGLAGSAAASFAGGPGHHDAHLFICPNRRVAMLESVAYPDARVAVVGSPKLDAWLRIPKPRNGQPVIAVTFHWNQCLTDDQTGQLIPEAGWAWPDWRDTIAELARRFPGQVLGHGHPRAQRELAAWWAEIGVEFVPDAVELLHRADCLVLDNSSLGFEWAALDRPTVWLRGRCWTAAAHGPPRFQDDTGKRVPLPGPELGPWALDRPDPTRELVDAILTSLNRYVLARADCRARVWDGLVDGKAARRAADAVLKLAGR